MSSYYHHSERKEQRYTQNSAPIVGVGSWINRPVGIAPPLNVFSPAIYGGPLLDVGNGQQSSYSVRTYTYPGRISYYEWSG